MEIGAFRTFPEGYKPPEEGPSEYQTIPLSKIEDFGVHANQYYSLDVSFFKARFPPPRPLLPLLACLTLLRARRS